MDKLRVIFGMLILLCFLYFVAGGIAVWVGAFSADKYFVYAGGVGGLASVVGLIAFIWRPTTIRKDIRELELESLKELTTTTEVLQALDSVRATTEEEINSLTLQKEQMEVLVRTASLALFLQEQHKLHEQRILDEVAKHEELSTSLGELSNIDQKLNTLNQEIEADPNVELLKEVIQSAQARPTSTDTTQEFLDGIQNPWLRAMASFSLKAMGVAFRAMRPYY